MSFGFSGNNNNSSGFGGFGSSNTGGGFGSNQNTSTGGSLFGGNTSTAGGFGGFGANNTNNNSSPFGGNKPAFGASAATTSGGSLFGGNTSTSGGFGGGGGFGNNANANTSSGIGGNTGGGLFGQNKPAAGGFGSANTGNSLFGGSNTAAGGFGGSNTNANPFSSNSNTNANASPGFGASSAGNNFTFGASSNTSNTAGNNNNGTAPVPFQPFSEKEGTATQLFQSITFQDPYRNKGFEELRVEDYAQGRRYGNSNGQAGSFGQSTGFGNFGGSNTSTGGGMFGNNTSTTNNNPFGGASGGGTGGFGSGTGGLASNTNSGGGLFGNQNQAQNKPGGLFGASTSGANTGGFGSTSGGGGGLFAGGGGFGNNTNTTNTSGGLFGGQNQNQQQQQQQNKPAFGGFGSTNNTTGGSFGSNTNAGGGLFGSSNNANTGSGGLFGQPNNQQQQQQSNPFGGTTTNTGGGLFGNQQNKPASGGLFGSSTNTNTGGGGLFGAQNNQQQQQGGGLFGSSTNTGGGLFGNQNQNTQNKPAGTGLFGSSTNANAGGSLFGNQNNQQQAGSSLFAGGNANSGNSLFGNQQKPAGNSIFGNNAGTANATGGSSLFGGNQQNQSGGGTSLFGGLGQSNQNQQNNNSNSLFGGSLNQQATPQNQLHASLTGAPYGNEQLFSSLGAASPPVGPLATPLSGARPVPRKTQSLLASARVNTPVYSPRGSMGRNGYGFSYSTYGTPGSAFTSSSLTPGASSLLKPTGSLSSALTSRLNKSFSTSNLRQASTPGEERSLLRPSAFSPEGTPGRYSSGSVRKLKIDRSLRTDLFGADTKAIEAAKEGDGPNLRKRVSFDRPADRESTTPEAGASQALVRTEDREESESPGIMRAAPTKPHSVGKTPEMEQVNGALSTVPEDSEAPRPSSAPGNKMPSESSKRDEPGEYYTKPALKDLKNMSRQQLKNVGNFIVGRDGIGRIEFGSVDLTNTPLEDMCGDIVRLNPRSATVYQDDQDKPAMGKALNVPSTIYLEHSWPRSHGGRKPVSAKSGKEYDKHIARLKRVGRTHFVSYDPETGIWCFKVDHFTTYELNDDDDESEFQDDSRMQDESSVLSDAPETPLEQQDVTLESMDTGTGDMEDTFQFKLDRRSQLSVPGGFDSEGVTDEYDDQGADEEMQNDSHMMSGGLSTADMDDPFTASGGPVQAPSPGAMERYHSSMIEDQEDGQDNEQDEQQDMPGSFIPEPTAPRSILKPNMGMAAFTSPEKLATESWEEQLQRTLSPKKRDRQALKDMQKSLMRVKQGEDIVESPFKQSMLGQSALGQSYLAQKSAKKSKAYNGSTQKSLGQSQAFSTAMDIMDSVFDQQKTGRKAGAKGFEYPYAKKPRLSHPDESSSQDSEWHACLKPHFAPNGLFVYATEATKRLPSGLLNEALAPVVDQRKDIHFGKFETAEDVNPQPLLAQKEETTIDTSSDFPAASAPGGLVFASLAENVEPERQLTTHEKTIWQLCSVLFDPAQFACAQYMQGIPDDQLQRFESRMRMDALGALWAQLVATDVQDGLKRARTAEERALLHLTRNDIVAACEVLMNGKDYKLAMLVSQLPGSQKNRELLKHQISAWRDRNDWSEMSEPVRALYCILAGELCLVRGKSGAIENRAAEFNIAEKFGLSWRQSFSLRLYFGGFQTIEDSMHAYFADLHSKRELVQPTTVWDDGVTRDDIHMKLLWLSVAGSDLPTPFDAGEVSGSEFKPRLAWQLTSLLHAKGYYDVTTEQFDQITYSFAAQLEAAGKLISSVWTLLHLQDSNVRQAAVAGLLDRHGDSISTPGNGERRGTFEDLTKENHIPATLVWRAKALFAKGGRGKSALQAEWLLRAGDLQEAHDVLCTVVGPHAVIEQDYVQLSDLLQWFTKFRVEDWEQGGQVYVDFIRLLRAQVGKRQSGEVASTIQRLQRGLAKMQEDSGRRKSLEQRVAMIEMERVMQEAIRERGGGDMDQEMWDAEDYSQDRGMKEDMLRSYHQAMGMAV